MDEDNHVKINRSSHFFRLGLLYLYLFYKP